MIYCNTFIVAKIIMVEKKEKEYKKSKANKTNYY